ncbi:thioredoxin family protein [Aquimarina agarilytica]|uniref:thioredoxin family protein n=1 Tax=Aquimarina agarilytica TaxID=1087449 RepID=UPI000289A369|nr:thioredoxin family protein [Aquimarina agarilytica]
MAATESQMVSLGTIAPDFNLLNTVTNSLTSLNELKSDKATVILFICNHCPFVIHINKALSLLANKYQTKGVNFIAISSNDIEKYPADAPELMTTFALENKYSFPYLYDEDQSVAKAYGAECTPDIFVYDKDLKLAYRGRFDATRPNMGTATGEDLAKALDSIILTNSYTEPQLPSIGCGIKWK